MQEKPSAGNGLNFDTHRLRCQGRIECWRGISAPQTNYSCKTLHIKSCAPVGLHFFTMAWLHGIARGIYGEKMMAKECPN
jgi:hypothetical protein